MLWGGVGQGREGNRYDEMGWKGCAVLGCDVSCCVGCGIVELDMAAWCEFGVGCGAVCGVAVGITVWSGVVQCSAV